MVTVTCTPMDNSRLRYMAGALRALGSVLRLRILVALAEQGQSNVTDLSEALRVSQPLLSWHLNELRLAGFLEAERIGREVRYSLNPQAFQVLAQDLEVLLGLPFNPTSTMEVSEHG